MKIVLISFPGPWMQSYYVKKLRINELLGFVGDKQDRHEKQMLKPQSHYILIALNQGTVKGMGGFIPFLIFLWLLSLHQESDKLAVKKVYNQVKVLESRGRKNYRHKLPNQPFFVIYAS